MRAENAAVVVDGNAAAGILSEIFAGEVTTIVGTCGGCGMVAPLAEAVVELDEVGAIVRCRGCTHTLVTVLRTRRRESVVVFGALHDVRIRRSERSAQQQRDRDQHRHAADRREEHRVARDDLADAEPLRVVEDVLRSRQCGEDRDDEHVVRREPEHEGRERPRDDRHGEQLECAREKHIRIGVPTRRAPAARGARCRS